MGNHELLSKLKMSQMCGCMHRIQTCMHTHHGYRIIPVKLIHPYATGCSSPTFQKKESLVE